jgi:hypothetical protein
MGKLRECGIGVMLTAYYEGWNFNNGNTAVETPCNGTK